MQRLLRRHRFVLGDPASLRDTKSVRIYGEIREGEARRAFELSQRDTGLIRQEIVVDGAMVVQVFDGEDGWRWVDDRTDLGAQRLTPEQSRFFRLFNGFYSPLQNYAGYGFDIEYLGEETNEDSGVAEHHLRLVSAEHGDQLDVWLDARTLRESQRSYRPAPEAMPLEFRFENYKLVDGLYFPFRIIVEMDGVPLAETQVESVETNVGLLSFFFTKPRSYEPVNGGE